MPTALRRWRWLPRASTCVALVIGLEGLLSVVLGVALMVAQDRDALKAEVGRQQVTVVGRDEVSGLVWGWPWGPVGALLAVPIAAGLRIVLANIPATAPLARYMGVRPRFRPGLR